MYCEVGTPIRFKSPHTNRMVVGKVMLWAGFRVVEEILPAEEKILPFGTRWTIPEQTRYIRLTQLESIEEISTNEYFLHKLKHG